MAAIESAAVDAREIAREEKKLMALLHSDRNMIIRNWRFHRATIARLENVREIPPVPSFRSYVSAIRWFTLIEAFETRLGKCKLSFYKTGIHAEDMMCMF